VVPKTEQVAGAALEALLRGTSEADVPAGRSTNLPPGVELNSLSIDNGLATADFSEQLEYQVAGSCRVTAIRAQIADTLLQFESVTDALISINGRVDGVLQP
jgi:spore germination protein GerM